VQKLLRGAPSCCEVRRAAKGVAAVQHLRHGNADIRDMIAQHPEPGAFLSGFPHKACEWYQLLTLKETTANRDTTHLILHLGCVSGFLAVACVRWVGHGT
jgi:hypothetical protein